MPWPSEEAKEAYYKERNKQQRRMVYLVIIVPILIGMFSAATGLWWIWPVVLFSGIGVAMWCYDKRVFGFALLYLLLMLIIVVAG